MREHKIRTIGRRMKPKLSTEQMAGLFGRVTRSEMIMSRASILPRITDNIDASGKIEIVRDYDDEEGDDIDMTSDESEMKSDSSSSNSEG